jgi:hypothetical protein
MSTNPADVNQVNPTGAPAGKTYEEELRELEELLGQKFPPLIAQGKEAFRRDFPRLLKKHRGKWVAYSGDQQIGIARSDLDLYEQCFRSGLKRTEFVILRIDPEAVSDFDAEVEILTPEMDE